MLAPKGPTFNGRPTFSNPMYLKKAQSKKPCLYAILYDQSDPGNRLVPDKEETLTLEKESRSKLNKDLVRPYDYTKLDIVESLEKEIDELESDKAEFSNMYDILLQECVSNDVMCSYLHSLSDLDAHTELQCLYLHKVKECEFLAQKLSKQTETIIMPCVSKFLNDVNARTKKPNVVPISTRKPKSHANKFVATLPKKTVASESTIQNSKSYYRMLYEKTSIEFLNNTLNAFFKEEGIKHQTSTPPTPEHNGIVERQNRTLVEAAQMMLSASKLPLKPSIRHLHIFGCTCYLTKDGENLDKMKEKGDMCILVGYSTQFKGYRVYNKRTRLIVESIHLRFDEIKEMAETSVDNNTSGLVPQQHKVSDYDNSGLTPQLQNVSPLANTTAPSQQDLDLLFDPLYDEFFTVGTSGVNKSSSPTDNFTQDTPRTTNV
ncbi:retrovirus-related pol polyprotein from transposon TNT 1-94 [Tanacetum coccineum]